MKSSAGLEPARGRGALRVHDCAPQSLGRSGPLQMNWDTKGGQGMARRGFAVNGCASAGRSVLKSLMSDVLPPYCQMGLGEGFGRDCQASWLRVRRGSRP